MLAALCWAVYCALLSGSCKPYKAFSCCGLTDHMFTHRSIHACMILGNHNAFQHMNMGSWSGKTRTHGMAIHPRHAPNRGHSHFEKAGQHHTSLPEVTAQHSTAQHSTAQHSTAQHSTAQHSTAQHSTTAKHSTAQHSTAQHSTAQHSTTQHSTAQHSTAQHRIHQDHLRSTAQLSMWPSCR